MTTNTQTVANFHHYCTPRMLHTTIPKLLQNLSKPSLVEYSPISNPTTHQQQQSHKSTDFRCFSNFQRISYSSRRQFSRIPLSLNRAEKEYCIMITLSFLFLLLCLTVLVSLFLSLSLLVSGLVVFEPCL